MSGVGGDDQTHAHHQPRDSINLPLLGHISIGESKVRRIETACVFFASLYFFVLVLTPCCIGVSASLFFFLPTAPLMIGYIIWINMFDKASITGSRSPFLRGQPGSSFWRHFCDFFPITLVKTADLNPERKYVFGYHPHGIISVGAVGAIVGSGARTLDLTVNKEGRSAADVERKNPRGWESLFPGIDRRLITLPVNFSMPFSREIILSLGLVNSDKRTFRNVLKKGSGSAVCVVVGGAKEATFVEEGTINLVLEGRKGFVRESIMAGACLVPIMAFGENDIYHVVELRDDGVQGFVKRMQAALLKITGVAFPLFRGRSVFFKDFGLMPFRKPINVVVGAPIEPPLLTPQQLGNFRPKFNRKTHEPENGDAKIVEKFHHQYVEAVKALYQTHKNARWNMPGLKRLGTLHVN